MTKIDDSNGGRVKKTMSRRQQKKAAQKLERARSDRVCADADAAIRNSRAARFHQILTRPGRGGLTAKGAEQLQRFFSKKVPKTEKPTLGDLDDSASMVLLEMASKEVDAGVLTYKELRQMTEQNLMANGAVDDDEKEEGEGGGKAKNVTGTVLEDEDEYQGGVALANDL